MSIRKISFISTLIAVFVVLSNLSFAEARQRDTKTLVLENGLAVLLIHDAEAHRSAAALAVGVGQIHDPAEKMGLAHYLEHMLFLGTKKFPEVGTFKKFLEENSGASNAYTGSAVTNYFFQVSQEGLEGFTGRVVADGGDTDHVGAECDKVGSDGTGAAGAILSLGDVHHGDGGFG